MGEILRAGISRPRFDLPQKRELLQSHFVASNLFVGPSMTGSVVDGS